MRHVVVSGQDASLSRVLRDQVEVIVLQVVLILDHLLINERALRRILEDSVLLNKESLSDPLVDDDDCHEGLFLGLVVGLINGCLELRYLLKKNLASHSITNTISIDDEVFRVVLVLVSETAKSSLDGILELR